MLTIHHLGVSQSDRVVWLLEELGLPYELKWYDRGADGLMPPEYLALHPAATAPVLEDDGRMIVESAVILEYVCRRYADGRLTVSPGEPSYFDYLYWMQFNNNIQGLFFARLALGEREGPDTDRVRGFIERRENGYRTFLEQRLGESEYLGGPAFSCADIMVTFNLTSLPSFAGRGLEDVPNVAAYLQRITKRPAYERAMSIAGPAATRPA